MQQINTLANGYTPRMLFTGGIIVFWSIVSIAVVLIAADWLLKPATYPVKRISFGGPFQHVNQRQLESAVLQTLSGSFITADLNAAQEQVTALPWVHQAWVSRRWPNAVHVQFSEQNFVARWGARAWLNNTGVAVLLPQGDGPTDVPLLQGPTGSELKVWRRYQKLQAPLAAAGLTIVQLELTQRRMWKLKLQSGIELVIGRREIDERIARFISIYPFLLKKKGRINRVDLRYANGLAAAWADGRQTFSRQRFKR